MRNVAEKKERSLLQVFFAHNSLRAVSAYVRIDASIAEKNK
jgi:hypothetical protein